MLLAAGAKTDLDPLRCILVAIRAERCAVYMCLCVCLFNYKKKKGLTLDLLLRYELVQLLLSYGAEVNCYFRVISNTSFPTALQYCLRDPVMMRLLLNSGYQAERYIYLL